MANILEVNRPNNKITLGTTGTTINIDSHTASLLLSLDASKNLESVSDLTVWVAGTANQITVTDDTDGTVTLSLPQDYDTGATPTLGGLTIVNAITEFSTDGTMGGDSDSAVPTEKATKLYTDTLRSDLASTSNAEGASLVGIEDSATYFDAGDVEAALAELMVLVTPVEYNPTMSRTAGGDAGGNDASVATIDDADSYDTDEISATPGFDIQAVFTGVTDFNQVQIHTAYDGNPAHVIRIDLDKAPFNWSSFDTILADIDDSSGDFVFNAITVASAGQYINSGEVRLRFYHSSAGNATHDFFIDYCALWKTGTSVGVTEHGGLTGLGDDDHLQYIKDIEFTQDSGILVGTGAGTFAEETGATLRTSIGVGTGDSPLFTAISIGNADTTITRVSAGVIAVEGTTVMLVGDTPTAHTIASHSDTTGTGTELDTLTDGSDVGALHTHAAAYQPLDAELTSLAALSYVAASFVKMTGANTFALRTIGETADDLEATIDHDNLANGGAHDYAYISGNDGATGVTAAELEELSDGSETALHSHAGTGGIVVQVVNVQTGAVATGTTQIPYDDSIPQKTEGDEYMTLAITPISATNKLKIDIVFECSADNDYELTVALFQDEITNALAAMPDRTYGNDYPANIKFTHYMTSDTTSEIIFKVRAGPSGGTNLTFNGQDAGNRKLGGVMASSITITEIQV